MNVGWGMGADILKYKMDPTAKKRLGVDMATAEAVVTKVMFGIEELRGMFSPSKEAQPHGV